MRDPRRQKPKTPIERAKTFLRKARNQARLAKKGVEIKEDDVTVTFLFQAYENAVVAAASAAGFVRASEHWQRAEQAEELVVNGYLEMDVSERLADLNAGRKRVAYGYEEEFEHADFREMIDELDTFFSQVERLIEQNGKKIKSDEL